MEIINAQYNVTYKFYSVYDTLGFLFIYYKKQNLILNIMFRPYLVVSRPDVFDL